MSNQFKVTDLNGKTVQVRIPLQGGFLFDGEATFNATEDAAGNLHVAVLYGVMSPDRKAITDAKVFVPPDALQKIVKNPPGSKCEFNLIAV